MYSCILHVQSCTSSKSSLIYLCLVYWLTPTFFLPFPPLYVLHILLLTPIYLSSPLHFLCSSLPLLLSSTHTSFPSLSPHHFHPPSLFLSQTSAAYVLFYCRRDEGQPVDGRPLLNRTLSQSFAEEVKKRRERYHPSETSCDEGDEKMEQGGGAEGREGEDQMNNNQDVRVW